MNAETEATALHRPLFRFLLCWTFGIRGFYIKALIYRIASHRWGEDTKECIFQQSGITSSSNQSYCNQQRISKAGQRFDVLQTLTYHQILRHLSKPRRIKYPFKSPPTFGKAAAATASQTTGMFQD
ncbi:hypothetical protein J437_LFUL001622 [Ladona fulva]|uniref:Uncharacterized protein n=1 Tax=Ladona fulva TaxID=123851 RepID=A0A8K0JXK0_LADFU|nr:hypothetical protein J437_LFUL001622 [Ladona fulva]